MKKILLLLIVAFAVTANSNAQGLDALLGKLKQKATENSQDGKDNKEAGDELLNLGQSLLGGVVNTIVGGKAITPKDLAGTWGYKGTSCKLESEDMIAEVGASLVTVKVEEKLDELLLKAGVAEGKASVEFDANGNCVATIGMTPFQGTYTIGEDGKSIIFSFLMGQFTLNSVIEYRGNEMNVTFDADKILAIVKNVSASASQYAPAEGGQATQLSQTMAIISTFGTMLEGYNGMRLGLKLAK